MCVQLLVPSKLSNLLAHNLALQLQSNFFFDLTLYGSLSEFFSLVELELQHLVDILFTYELSIVVLSVSLTKIKKFNQDCIVFSDNTRAWRCYDQID